MWARRDGSARGSLASPGVPQVRVPGRWEFTGLPAFVSDGASGSGRAGCAALASAGSKAGPVPGSGARCPGAAKALVTGATGSRGPGPWGQRWGSAIGDAPGVPARAKTMVALGQGAVAPPGDPWPLRASPRCGCLVAGSSPGSPPSSRMGSAGACLVVWVSGWCRSTLPHPRCHIADDVKKCFKK